MVDLNLDSMQASFVVGNCHKWMCTPKGAGFLFVREHRRDGMIPALVSHGWNTESSSGGSRFHNLFDWTGTDDPTARLAVPAAIDVVANMHPGGWPGVMTANRNLVLLGRDVICEALGIAAPAPDADIGSMATIELPRSTAGTATGALDPLTDRLRETWSIEVPVFPWRDRPRPLLRISAQLYNKPEDYERLAEALRAELAV
jgi:isopenicillin-N epimerase